MQRGHDPDGEQDAGFRTLRKALEHYRRGEGDLKSCATEAGLPEWDFLTEVHATPDPVAKECAADLPTFVRDRH